MQKFIFLGICLLLSVSCSTMSGKSNKTAKEEAVALFEVMKLSENLEETIVATLDTQIDSNPELLPYRDVMLEFMKKYMSYESLKEDLITIYTSDFSADELKNIKEFYETETGQKCVSLFPELFQKGSELGANRVQENMAELQQMLMEVEQGLE